MIPSDLYNEIPKFVDKKTLHEYISSVENNNNLISKELKHAYNERFKPFEENFNFNECQPVSIEDAFFETKPMILLIGQYSSGKSTFSKYLIEKDYPGIRIGPEPTTDKFVAVMYGNENAIIPGNALVVDESKQFKPLIKFGGKFLNRFQGALVDSPVLKGLTIIDTPGILTDNSNEAYDYKAVIEWFAQQADRVFLFVDANKLELSGSFQKILEMIRAYDDKLRIVLNKTDIVTEQELIRIYGALMWFLGQSLEMKEVIQIYVGSFWSQPIKNENKRKLYEFEEYRIFQDLSNLPKESLLRKVNIIAKRTREVTIHACIISTLKDNYKKSVLKYVWKKKSKQILLKKLKKIFWKIEKEYGFNKNDFPDLKNMKQVLNKINFDKIKTYNKKLFINKDIFIDQDIPLIIERIYNEKFQRIFEFNNQSPFNYEKGKGFDEGSLNGNEWIVAKYKPQYKILFDELKSENNEITASKAKAQMLKSSLPAKVLNKIWTLSDIDRNGMFDLDEFSLAMYLISVKLENYELPDVLPKHLIPPSKR